MPFSAAGNVIGGYKAALNNDNVSEEAVRLHEAQLAYIATSASILTLQRYFAYRYIEKGGRAEDRGDQELWRRHVRQSKCAKSVDRPDVMKLRIDSRIILQISNMRCRRPVEQSVGQ
jgi:hypothetical protein